MKLHFPIQKLSTNFFFIKMKFGNTGSLLRITKWQIRITKKKMELHFPIQKLNTTFSYH